MFSPSSASRSWQPKIRLLGKQQTRCLHLHEYQSQQLLKQHGIPVPRGKLAQSPTQAAHIVKEFGRGCLIKPQTLTGQRFSFRSAPIAQTAKDAEAVTSTLLGTGQAAKLPSDKAVAVKKVYVTESLPFEDTWYLALTLDREACAPIMIASKNKAASSQEQVTGERREEHVFRFDLTNGITQELTSNVAELVNAPQGGLESIRNILNQLYDLFQTRDATLIEINALAKAKDGTFICLDSNFTADDASEKRQPELFSLRDEGAEVPEEMEARKHGLIYIKLGGNIGNVVNGAGLAMATNDAINYHGGTSANFLDAGGQATKQTMQKAFDIILRDDRVRVILINIYGGIIKCDMIAESIIGAAQELGPLRVPLVVRLQGTNSSEGLKILDEADLGFFVESDFDKAAEKAVELAKLA
ncbi:Succinate--CoA ligase [ADP-forming] subunit beta, mitochondrial [Fusarium sp. Ph1]|nr:Succinate--CoA ligase [ADP-forming] subunit beta, mitochondrial [Fusarium sp. Ph1]